MLIIINGQGSTGKTTLANELSSKLNISLFAKDAYKEKAYDQLGKTPSLIQWLRIERQSWRTMYQAVEKTIAQNESLIIEGNFMSAQKQKLIKVLSPDTKVIEIYCYAPARVVINRFKARNINGTRHLGHRDNLWVPIVYLEAFAGSLGWHWVKPLRLSEDVITLDTSDFSQVDISELERYIKSPNASTSR